MCGWCLFGWFVACLNDCYFVLCSCVFVDLLVRLIRCLCCCVLICSIVRLAGWSVVWLFGWLLVRSVS